MGTDTDVARVDRVQANGTTLYAESYGEGPPVLLIAGAGGDAAHLSGVAGALADEFAVTTYDRRGNSRSPAPQGWATTSVTEQADDAAALLVALNATPAVVFGTSLGGIVALDLALRHPDLVSGVIVHEPPIPAITSNPEAVMANLQALVEHGMAAGGPGPAMEVFMRWAAGDDAFEHFDPADRARYLSNGAVYFGVEMPSFGSYVPTPEALQQARRPILAAGSAANRDPDSPGHFLYEAASWVTTQLGTELAILPGGHGSYFSNPEALAQTLRPFMRKLAEPDAA